MTGKSSTPDYFWSRVDIRGPDECWPWKGSLNTYGYGQAHYKTWNTNAHRVAYFLTHGEVNKAKVICHSCDNPACCNPKHLWEGTQGENVRDCNIKKRGRGLFSEKKGIRHPRYVAKMTPEQVSEARELYWKHGWTQKLIGKKYGVHPATISRTVRGENWNHIPITERYT